MLCTGLFNKIQKITKLTSVRGVSRVWNTVAHSQATIPICKCEIHRGVYFLPTKHVQFIYKYQLIVLICLKESAEMWHKTCPTVWQRIQQCEWTEFIGRSVVDSKMNVANTRITNICCMKRLMKAEPYMQQFASHITSREEL